MKLIKAIVRPNKVDDVKAALEAADLGHDRDRSAGHGKQKGPRPIYRGQEYNVSLLPKMEVESSCPIRWPTMPSRPSSRRARTGGSVMDACSMLPHSRATRSGQASGKAGGGGGRATRVVRSSRLTWLDAEDADYGPVRLLTSARLDALVQLQCG